MSMMQRAAAPLALLTATLILGALVPAPAAAQWYDAEPNYIEVMFIQESTVRLRDGELVDLTGNAVEGLDAVLLDAAPYFWERIAEVTEEQLDELAANGQAHTGEPVYNLNNIYRLRYFSGLDVWLFSQQLEGLAGVLSARPVPLPMELPQPPDYQPNQGYLQAAGATPSGIDAIYAWTLPGGDGTGVTVCDLEYAWNYNHADVTKALNSQILLGASDPMVPPDPEHGTGVIGVLVADRNGWGTTGACPGASLRTAGTYLNGSWNVTSAIASAAMVLTAGDVILLEQQWDNTGSNGFVPIEWWTDSSAGGQSFNAVYAAITNAIANGINVVEAGGNGGINTDLLSWYGDSGAIIVGAGGAYTGGTYPEGNLQRLSFSSYGSRYNLQGWGEDVYTTGYGTLYSAQGNNYYYTAAFNGTSSASPVVAAAVANCVGYWLANLSPSPPTPAYIRSLLMSTGTAQITPPAGNIGPRPDLNAAFAAMAVPSPWTDVTAGLLATGALRRGVAWGDYDGDADPDLYVTVDGSANQLLRNDPGGFSAVTAPVAQDPGPGAGAAWGDYDGDGRLDLYLTNFGPPNVLMWNLGGGAFANAGDPTAALPGNSTGVSWVDFDLDGDLDLYCSNYSMLPGVLLANTPPGFMDASGALATPGDCFTAVWGDWDGDGDQDPYVTNNNSQANHLWRNDNVGFIDVTTPPVDDPSNSSSAAWGDCDNDGDLDLYVVNYGGQANRLFRNDGGGSFVDVASGPLADTGYGRSATWGDYDNDGDLDLYLVNDPGPNRLLRNDGGYLFADDTSGPMGDSGNGQGAAWADFDQDGDVDLALANYGGTARLLRNDLSTGNHWLHVDLIGITMNTRCVGARVRVVTGGMSQLREVGTGAGYMSQNSLTEEFGLGAATVADTVEVRFGSGAVLTVLSVAADQRMALLEPPLTAAPARAVPRTLVLHPCAPNPANPVVTFAYDLPEGGPVWLRIYDLAGRLVREVRNGVDEPAGSRQAVWDGRDAAGRAVATGVYLCRLEAAGQARSRTLTLLK